MACDAVPEPLGLAELPSLGRSMFVMPCPPPLTPPSQGGEKARSGALSFDFAHEKRRLETVPQARPTVSFHHPTPALSPR